jgi:serine/threonine protein kinase
MLLTGLDHLHTKCHIIHTGTQLVGNKSSLQDEIDLAIADLKPDNILLGIEHQAVIEDLVNDEAEEPSPRKMEGSRAIYPSRNFGDLQSPPGPPKLRTLVWLFGVMFLNSTTTLFRLISSKLPK